MLQVESLMQDKANLLQENRRLRRENEQLQELVGYLSANGLEGMEE
jgi:regulator of replication initiation timing